MCRPLITRGKGLRLIIIVTERLSWTSCRPAFVLKTITDQDIHVWNGLVLPMFVSTTARLSGTCVRHVVRVAFFFPDSVRHNFRGNKYWSNCPWDTRTNTRRSSCWVVEHNCKKLLCCLFVYIFRFFMSTRCSLKHESCDFVNETMELVNSFKCMWMTCIA
jgi:hypothetical protein